MDKSEFWASPTIEEEAEVFRSDANTTAQSKVLVGEWFQRIQPKNILTIQDGCNLS
jgi:hypothetical protein